MPVDTKLSADTRGPRLVHAEVRPLGQDECLVVAPSGALFEIAARPSIVEELLTRCDGTVPLDALAADSPDPEGYREILTELLESGCLVHAERPDADAHWARFAGRDLDADRPARTTLVLLGDAPLLDLLASIDVAGHFRTVLRTTRDDLAATLDRECGDVLVVAVRDRIDADLLIWLNDLCAERGVRWSQFHLAQGHGFAGPAIVPGRTPDYRDLLARRLTAAERVELHEALLAAIAFGHGYLPPTAELVWMLSCFLIDLERDLVGAATASWAEMELDPVEMSVVRHPVLPLPDRPVEDDTPVADERILVDARTGLITGLPRFPHHESIPSRLVTIQSNVADMRRVYTWANNTVCGGSKFDDPRSAEMSSIGEAVERYCGNCVTSKVDVREASYEQLVAAGQYAVDPSRLVLYSDRLYDSPGFPFVRFTPDLVTHWVRGTSLTAQRPVWIPASLVYVNWYMDQYADAPATNYLYYPGIAAGPDLEWALASGLEEIVERDATMIWWHNRQPLPRVRMTDELAAIWAGTPLAHGQRPSLIYLENEFNIPVMAGVLEKPDEGLLNVGFAARNDPVEAARKAWTEAITLQDGSRDLDNPNGLTRNALAEGWVSLTLQPWREDRRYLDSYAPDFHDVDDLMCQQQVFLDPRAADIVRPWLDTPVTRSMAEVPSLPDRSLATYQRLIEARGYEIVYADLTTQDVAKAGFHVARVIVPGLVPNSPAAFPFLGNRRIQDAAVQLGWRTEPLAEEDLNYFPLPHA
ncbi:YcaO-like family protein [Actinomycetes bacterium KLBMP 9797]